MFIVDRESVKSIRCMSPVTEWCHSGVEISKNVSEMKCDLWRITLWYCWLWHYDSFSYEYIQLGEDYRERRASGFNSRQFGVSDALQVDKENFVDETVVSTNVLMIWKIYLDFHTVGRNKWDILLPNITSIKKVCIKYSHSWEYCEYEWLDQLTFFRKL